MFGFLLILSLVLLMVSMIVPLWRASILLLAIQIIRLRRFIATLSLVIWLRISLLLIAWRVLSLQLSWMLDLILLVPCLELVQYLGRFVPIWSRFRVLFPSMFLYLRKRLRMLVLFIILISSARFLAWFVLLFLTTRMIQSRRSLMSPS